MPGWWCPPARKLILRGGKSPLRARTLMPVTAAAPEAKVSGGGAAHGVRSVLSLWSEHLNARVIEATGKL